MQRSKKLFGRISRFEPLENRMLLAGNVTSSFAGGLLTLTGDSAANNIQVSQLGNGNWQVKGNSTKIDGSNSAETFTGVTDITIDLAAGNDVLKVQNGTLTGKLFVDYTAGVQGSKTTQFANLHVGTFDVEQASTGNNVVTMNNIMLTTTIGGIVTTGSGKDVVSLNNIYAFGITVNTAGGNDAITITNSFGQDDITVNAGDGSDVVVLKSCFSDGIIDVETSSTAADGNDVVQFSGLNAGSILVNDQNGSDTVVGSNSTFSGGSGVNIDLADSTTGNDTIVLTNINTTGSLLAFVGVGTNAVAINKCHAGGEYDIDARGTNAVSVANSTTDDELFIYCQGSSAISVSNVTAADNCSILGGSGTNVISINKLNVLSGQTNIETGNAGDVIAIVNSKFNSSATASVTAPWPVALTIETHGGNDVVTMVNDTVVNGANINTGDGTDSVSITNLNATALDVSVGGGKYDTVVIARSTALAAEFDGQSGNGDTLIYKHLQNHFDTETDSGFDHVS